VNEFKELHFPREKLFDTFEWQTGFLQHWKFDPEKQNYSCVSRGRSYNAFSPTKFQ
jgi:hypothetical protein